MADSQAPLGHATTRVLDRLLASCGMLTAAGLEFAPADDVPQAGVLCALPALLTEGLLRHTRTFYTLPAGYYPLESIFLYLALLALVRCKSLEQTRYQAPGEWGRILGLDRLPEVKTLRSKIATLCATQGQAAQWQSCLAKEWIEASSEAQLAPGEGLFYVDGHVRVYHGQLTALPRRYIARQRLCLRGTTDYWVNGLGGQPFFVVTAAVNSGLIAALRDHVIPQLLLACPERAPSVSAGAASPGTVESQGGVGAGAKAAECAQAATEALDTLDLATASTGIVAPAASTASISESSASAPSTGPATASTAAAWPRFTIVFDREAYSPQLFSELHAQNIAILTYHKFPDQPWPESEFGPYTLRRHNGEVLTRHLAERGTRLSNGLFVREVRLLNADGHQTSILTTHPHMDLPVVATRLADRWAQENWFKYTREDFGLDRIIEHGTTPLPEPTEVVNPARRRLEADLRHSRTKQQRLLAQLGAHELPAQPSPEQTDAYQTRGGELREALKAEGDRIDEYKQRRATTPNKVPLSELPEKERFAQLCPESKHFIDTIKVLAYRAESALAGEVREHLARSDDARALLKRVFVTPANLRPDYEAKTLTVELHRLGSALQDAAVAQLCETLTATETSFPTTDLCVIYRQVGSP